MKKTYKIVLAEGLHARPTTLLVTAVNQFKSDVTMTFKEKTVNLKSIMGVMALGVAPGSIIEISATGEDAEAMMAKVNEVMTSNGIGEEC